MAGFSMTKEFIELAPIRFNEDDSDELLEPTKTLGPFKSGYEFPSEENIVELSENEERYKEPSSVLVPQFEKTDKSKETTGLTTAPTNGA